MQPDGGLTPIDKLRNVDIGATLELEKIHQMFTSSNIKYNISHSSMLRFDGNRAILSGPAGGVVGYTMTSFEDQPSIGYNMGGTSADLSRYDGEYEHVFKSTTAGVTIQAQQRICQVIHGPAIIIDKISTILVEPDCKGKMTKKGDVTIMIGKGKPKHIGKELDAIQLSIFSHRFMSIAEQMGRILQRTTISTNIKERLDFSCALFGHDGGLVSNASHILGHLGAMQDAVQYQMRAIDINEGDCILSNHPCTGGVHLPDQSQPISALDVTIDELIVECVQALSDQGFP
ncbi:unnamed protein product [Clavelina lepadiformis]|uniref:Hydantoinase B/oxoprolinase domain-containing protein n=1 Tax=Clavelina lepadiformis TaxID=159417 RepID=A0ABP0G969_CLALP